jgi:RND family efflux transporter MFP subunit
MKGETPAIAEHPMPLIVREPVEPMRGKALLSRRFMIPAAIVALGGFATVSLLRGESRPHDQQAATPVALTVTVANPHSETWSDTVTAAGAVAAWQEASIGTQIGGFQLTDVRVNVGDTVRKGQVLAVLNPALLQAEEVRLLADHEQAAANLKRALSLKASGGISEQDVLQFETAEKTAAALLAGKRLELRYTMVRAPDDGVISARMATLGAVAPVGQELFRLIRRNRLEWRGELTAAQMAGVKKGQSVLLSLPDGSTATATIRQAAPMLDDRSRLGLVYADIPAGGPARAGMYATAHIVVGQSPASTIAASSVVMRDGRAHVMKVEGRGSTARAVEQPVMVGRRRADRSEIVHGLRPSDSVVVDGADFLNDGDAVRIVQPPAEATER